MTRLPKRLYPHINEWERLGRDETPEGRDYIMLNQTRIDIEYSQAMDIYKFRYMMGGNELIHNLIKDGHIE